MSQKQKTTVYSDVFDEKIAEEIYLYLQKNVKWEDGIYSKKYKQISRSAYKPDYESEIDSYILQIVITAINKIKLTNKIMAGIYLNYYKDGNDICPSHSHPGGIQLVISFGAIRTLIVGTKEYTLKSGECILFGSGKHNIPKEPEVKTGRISIAVFMINDIN